MKHTLLLCLGSLLSVWHALAGVETAPTLQQRDDSEYASASCHPKEGFGPVEILPHREDKNFILQSYPRFAQLGHGKILLTFSGFKMDIFESLDYGRTWRNSTTVKYNGSETFLQPSFLVLRQALGKFPEGTVLLSANVILNKTTDIAVFASTDEGKSWEVASKVASGANPFAVKFPGAAGAALQAEKPIWEPFLFFYNDTLVCYYSDERDLAHSQKLSYQVSKDGVEWSDPKDAVAEPKEGGRPGMINIAQMNDQTFFTVYEDLQDDGSYPVYSRKSTNPLAFQEAEAHPIEADDGTVPKASPNVAFTPFGGINGTLVVSSASSQNVMLSYSHGEGAWKNFTTNAYSGYAQAIEIADWADNLLLIASGSVFPTPNETRKFPLAFTAVELPAGPDDA